jgi:RHS repeat-associated protein
MGNGSGISAVRAFQAAKAAGIALSFVNQANIATVLPLLSLDEETITDIQNVVNAGLVVVVVPNSPVTVNSKTVIPLTLIDPATGNSAYLLNSDINGSLAYPSWAALSPVMHLAWDGLVPDLSNLSQASLSDSFVASFQAIKNSIADLPDGVPAANIGLLTEGIFYSAATAGLGCYLSTPASTPTGLCMAAYSGSLCIADSSNALSVRNAKPLANAGSGQNVRVNNPVTLDGSLSSDQDNDPLAYAWTITAKPEGSKAVIAAPATISTSFTPDVPGTYSVQLVVSDGKSFSDPAAVTVNASYETVSVPNLSGKTQAEAETVIIASHLAVGAITASSSETISSGSVMSQDPAPAAQAVQGSPIKIILSSGPAVDREKPTLTATFDRTPVAYEAGETATLYIDATDNSNNVTVTVTVDGVAQAATIPTTAISTTNFAPGSVHKVEVTAADSAGNSATLSLNLGIKDPADNTTPGVTIISPAPDAEITAPTEIIGTITTGRLLEYTLSYAPKGSTTFTEFWRGTTAVTNGTLGTFDPTLLKNGIYDIRLLAIDSNGRNLGVDTTWRITGDMKVGNFTVTFTDLSVPVTGLPVTVNRTYDSREKQSRDFGIGWTVDIQNVKIDENRTPGDGWPQTKSGGMFGSYCINGDTEHYVSVNLPDGRTEEFDLTLTPNCQKFSPVEQASVSFTPRPGSTSTLKLKYPKLLLVSNGMLIDPDTVEAYDPAGYVLTDKDGTEYELDQSFGIRMAKDANGNTLTYGKDGVTHSAGKGVRFVRDAKDRIVQVIDPEGNKITYTYNSKGELSTVTDAAGNITTYTYNRSHGLTGIKDPRGITPVKNEYDNSGRLVAHTDSYGKRIEYTHDIVGRQEVVKDRNGNLTVFIYDEKGRVLQKTDPMGSTTGFTYDGVGNKLSETDALGNTTRWTYDAKKNVLSESKIISGQTITTSHTYNALGKVLTTTDPLGHVTSNTYDAKGNLLTTTDALGNVTTNAYDAKGNLKTVTDALNNTTTYEYDGYGNRTKQTAAAGAITYWTYDAKGNKLSETDPRGTTTLYTYDASGKLISTENAIGAITRTDYDKARNKVAETNALGLVTWFYYDSANRLTTTEYPDGTTTKTIYDNEGNRIASIDQDGRTTAYEYNGSKQLIKTTYADQTTRQFGFDSAGRQTTATDALGNVTTKVYDALGRVMASIDPELNSMTFEYDLNGNQASQTDPNGHTTTFGYDANNRRISTTPPGGQVTQVGYDELGRKISETDAAGNTTELGYDASGNLNKVTDAEGGIARYEYDLNNNRTAIVDARNNRTTFAFDTLNRLISKTMPNGGIETYAYDKAGRQISKADTKGQSIQYGYDDNGRLRTRSYPDGSTVQFNYTNTGKRLSVADQRGTTSYAYDSMNRLKKNIYPDGKAINYGYDATGKLAALSSSLTGTVAYSYFNNGRLKEVTDPQGKITSYTYDAAGSRTGLSYPNGTTVAYVYDVNNRLTNLSHKNAMSEVIASYAYTLGAIGNRTRIDEVSGISRQYQYDRLYRLTQEKVSDPANTQTYLNDFSYDAVGNRLNKTKAEYSQSVASNDYTYNNADQLLTESGITYTYDLNGNLATKTDSAGTTTYVYNYDDRLVEVRAPNAATVTYKYDADNNRVSATTASGTTKYLVDTNRGLAQVLAEYLTAGNFIVSYVYSDDLISMNRSGTVSYYQFDGLGSTRLLTDATGMITDTYDFDAFGNQVARTGTTANEFLFTGQQYDANIDFYHLRARYYQPTTGRFISTDPYAGDPYAPMSLHKYLYAANDPVNKSDPSGKDWSFGSSMAAIGLSMTVLSIGVLIVQQFVSKKGQYDYQGEATYISGGDVFGGGIMEVKLTSESYQGKKYTGMFSILFVGVTFGAPVGKTSFPFKVHTGQVFGVPDLKRMEGDTWLLSGTIAVGAGPTLGVMVMGDGISDLVDFSGFVSGIDVSLDGFIGYSKLDAAY